ncbi:MAG: ATP-binding protein, partial [Flavitalea sp.]
LGPLEDALNSPQSITENATRLQMAHRNGLRLQKLVNTLLEFSRIEAGRVEGKFAQVDIIAFTKDLASTFRSAIEKAGMDLIIETEVVRDEVFVDTDMWEKIVLNLISNAFKYTSEGSIKLTIAQQGKNIKLSVTDTGTGIPDDQLDRIFERFHRIENFGGRSQEGTGIGLSMVKELVRLHGGFITVESEFGKGSTFTVEIPSGKEHLDDSASNNKINAKVSSGSAAFVEEALKWLPGESEDSISVKEEDNPLQKVIRIVLADDNTDMRDYINRLLSPKYEIITATNGEEAFEKILQHKPDLILSDVMMPRIDGFGLLKIVRENEAVKTTPFIFLSARAGEESRVEGLQAGADDYLVKPFSAKELFAKVESTIRISSQRVEMEGRLKLMVAEKTKALIQSNEDLQQFAHVASHDLKEPVRKIRTFTDRLQKNIGNLADEKSKTYFEKINSASSRMVSMIEGVLAFSTVNAGDIQPEKFSLSEVIANIEEDLELSILNKSAIIEARDLPDIVGARVLIYQLLYNLCSNSLKFSVPGSPVRISIFAGKAKVKPGYAELIVQDNGIGFDQQFASRIFETFTRLNSKDEYEGTGLGLALCKKIVERHGGEIHGESEEGKGTSIYFTLPVAN